MGAALFLTYLKPTIRQKWTLFRIPITPYTVLSDTENHVFYNITPT